MKKLNKFFALLIAVIGISMTAKAEEPAKTDYTDAIKNASVSEKLDWEGGLSHGNGGLYKTSAESFDFTQTITLPAGQYKMTVQAAYRYAGSNDQPTPEEHEYNQIQAGANTHLAKLYAKTASYKYEANVQNRWEGASDTDYLSNGSKTVNGKFVPNSSDAVKAWFNAGKYVNELIFNVQEEGDVKIGIAKTQKPAGGDYTNIGAWTLTRLGDAEADPKDKILLSSGWTKVETITDVANNYYVFVDAGSSNYAMAHMPNNSRGCYKDLIDPVNNFGYAWILEKNGDAYNIKNAFSKWYFNSGNAGWNNYMGANNDNANYTFTLSDGKYSIKSVTANGFLGPWNNNGAVANDGENVAANKSAEQAPGFYIYACPRSKFDSDYTITLKSATKESPIDATSYLFNADFEGKLVDGWNRTGNAGNQQVGNGTFESWNNNNISISQEQTNLPNGVYKVSVDVISGPDKPLNAYLYAKGSEELVSEKVTATASQGDYGTMGSEVAGKTLTIENVFVANNSLTVGIKDPSTGNGWIVFDNFKLYYYGVDLTALNKALNTLIAEAEDVSTKVNTGYKGVLNDAIDAAKNAQQTEADLTAKTTAMSAIIEEAKQAISEIDIVNEEIAVCESWIQNTTAEEADKTQFLTSIAEAKNDLDAANTIAGIASVKQELVKARKMYATVAKRTDGQPFDFTDFVSNPDFSSKNSNGWSITGTSGNRQWSTGSMEAWNNNNLVMETEVKDLPDGKYRVSADVIAGPNVPKNAYIFIKGYIADAKSEPVSAVASKGDYAVMSNEVAEKTLTTGDVFVHGGKLSFGLKDLSTGNGWFVVDNFKLYYLGTVEHSEHVEAYEATLKAAQNTAAKVDSAMEATLMSALNDAISTNVDKTDVGQLLQASAALKTATVNAENSIIAYAGAAKYFQKMKAVLDNTNVYTKEAYDDNYGNWLADYEARTLPTETAAKLNENSAYSTGHHSTNYIDDILLSAWTIDGKQAKNYDLALCINTWSTEGDTDGSEFRAPFFEYWTNDDKSLGATKIQAKVVGLEAKTSYSFTIRARVRFSNSKTGVENGITLQVGEGNAANISTGTLFDAGVFHYSHFTAVGETDENGTLTATINVVENSNISWLSFQNVRYAKGEDLSGYIADYEFALKEATEASKKDMFEEDKTTLTKAIADNTFADFDNVTQQLLIEAAKTLWNAAKVAYEKIDFYAQYQLLEKYIANAKVFGVDVAQLENEFEKKEILVKQIDSIRQALNVATYNKVATDYTNEYALTDWSTDELGTMTGQHWSGHGDTKYYDTSGSNFTRSTVKTATLPKGSFVLKAAGRSSTAAKLTLDVNGTIVEFHAKGDVGYGIDTLGVANFSKDGIYANGNKGRGWEWQFVKFTLDEQTEVTLKATISAGKDWAWGSMCDVSLWMDDATFEGMLIAAKSELSAEIANAESLAAANVGDGAFQILSTDANLKTLKNAIATAKMLCESDMATTDMVLAGIPTLKQAEETYKATISTAKLNAPAAGKKFNLVLTFKGWDYDGMAMTYFANDRSDAGKYNIKYAAAPNASYAQAFTFTPAESATNGYYLSMTDVDGNERYISTGVQYGGQAAQIRTTTDATKALIVQVRATATEGVYNLWNTEAKNYIGSQDAGVFTVNSHIDFKLVAAEEAEVTVDITIGYATLMLPFNAELPAGMKAYTCTANADEATLTLTEVKTLAANTPYLVEGEGSFEFNGYGLATKDSYTSASLTGTYTEVAAPVDSYVLQNGAQGFAFYHVAKDKQPKVGANRCYLTVPAGTAKAPMFSISRGEDTTGIENSALNAPSTVIYDLMGRKVTNMVKGNMYIVNGKKVVIK